MNSLICAHVLLTATVACSLTLVRSFAVFTVRTVCHPPNKMFIFNTTIALEHNKFDYIVNSIISSLLLIFSPVSFWCSVIVLSISSLFSPSSIFYFLSLWILDFYLFIYCINSYDNWKIRFVIVVVVVDTMNYYWCSNAYHFVFYFHHTSKIATTFLNFKRNAFFSEWRERERVWKSEAKKKTAFPTKLAPHLFKKICICTYTKTTSHALLASKQSTLIFRSFFFIDLLLLLKLITVCNGGRALSVCCGFGNQDELTSNTRRYLKVL